MPEDRGSIGRAIWSARPTRLVPVTREAIDAWLGTAGTEVLLIDYHQSHLVPFGGGDGGGSPIPVDAHPAGHAYATGRAVRDGGHLYLPLTVYGERMGVLTVRPPAETAASEEDLAEITADLARAIRLADTATDIYREVRRRKRLTVAAELQWDLLPGRTCESDQFCLAGQLEPAYTVSGDNFDWSLSGHHLTLSVSNGMGGGISAALLTQLTVNSLRNARRSGAAPAEAAELAGGIVYSQYGGAHHSSTVLLRIALATGEGEVVDAGSPRMLRVRRGEIEPVKLDQQMPLGMFSDTRYRVQPLSLQSGDRLIVVSDGLYDARSPAGRAYGSAMLSAALRSSRPQDPNETVRYLISNLLAHHEGPGLADDAIAVCLDWHGSGDHLVAASASLSGLTRPGGTSPDVMT